ncbi:MAG: hypothetical protein IJZ68_05670 [Bacteroidaceae bacterium]|nr:hypothetical protein [Bacteroidaceae bacterium]
MVKYTKEVACPICGQLHTLEYQPFTTLFLDAMPFVTMEQTMKMMALCTTCGWAYFIKDLEPINAVSILQGPEYQQVLHAEYRDETEKKLHLFEAIYHMPYMPAYYAHYYQEVGDRDKAVKWLRKMVDDVLDEKDVKPLEIEKHQFEHCPMSDVLAFYPDIKLVDLYRRLGDVPKTTQHIAYLRSQQHEAPPTALMEYLTYQETLLKQHNYNLA